MQKAVVRLCARRSRSAVAETGFLLNGVRMQTEQLTVQGGEQGLTLTFPRPSRKPNGTAVSSGDSGTEISVSGLVHLVRRGNGFLVINRVDIEEYVKGVVPAEVSSTWHPEMLKAQAVAARTYALYQQMLSATREYDVAATVQDQVYRGKQGVDAGHPARGRRDARAGCDLPGCADLCRLLIDGRRVDGRCHECVVERVSLSQGCGVPLRPDVALLSMEVLLQTRHPRAEFAAAGLLRGDDRDDDALVVQPRRASREDCVFSTLVEN